MKITINGQIREFSDTSTLTQIIGQFCKETNRIIAEVNGTIIKAPLWNATEVKDGDTIELVNFVGGG